MNKCEFSELRNITPEMVECSPESFCWTDCLNMDLVTDKALQNALDKNVELSWSRIIRNCYLSPKMWEKLMEIDEVMDYLYRGYKIHKTDKLGKEFISKYKEYLEIGSEFIEDLLVIRDASKCEEVQYEASCYIDEIECGLLKRHEKIEVKRFIRKNKENKMLTVNYINENMEVGAKTFNYADEAEAFEAELLNKGYSTSIVEEE